MKKLFSHITNTDFTSLALLSLASGKEIDVHTTLTDGHQKAYILKSDGTILTELFRENPLEGSYNEDTGNITYRYRRGDISKSGSLLTFRDDGLTYGYIFIVGSNKEDLDKFSSYFNLNIKLEGNTVFKDDRPIGTIDAINGLLLIYNYETRVLEISSDLDTLDKYK